MVGLNHLKYKPCEWVEEWVMVDLKFVKKGSPNVEDLIPFSWS
jgi:hypothetical protein